MADNSSSTHHRPNPTYARSYPSSSLLVKVGVTGGSGKLQLERKGSLRNSHRLQKVSLSTHDGSKRLIRLIVSTCSSSPRLRWHRHFHTHVIWKIFVCRYRWVELEPKVRVHVFAANHFFAWRCRTARLSEDGSVAASLSTAARSNNSHGYELLHWLYS